MIRMIFKGNISLDDKIVIVQANEISKDEKTDMINGVELYKFKNIQLTKNTEKLQYVLQFFFCTLLKYMFRPIEKIYVNDFDGNILNAPTTFYFEKKQQDGSWEVVEVTAHDYDANPKKYTNLELYKFVDNDMAISYQNFSDFGTDIRHQGPDRLIKDIMYALDND